MRHQNRFAHHRKFRTGSAEMPSQSTYGPGVSHDIGPWDDRNYVSAFELVHHDWVSRAMVQRPISAARTAKLHGCVYWDMRLCRCRLDRNSSRKERRRPRFRVLGYAELA